MSSNHLEQDNNSLLICVTYILNLYFGKISPKTLEAFGIQDNHPFDVTHALEIFKNFQLDVIQKSLSVLILPHYFLPAIIMNQAGHSFVYLKQIKDKAVVFDPIQKKEIELDIKKLKNYQQVLVISKDTKHLQYFDKFHNKAWFYEPLKAHWRSYIEIAVLTLFINIFALAIPLFVMNVYNRVIPNQAYETLFVLASGAVLFLLFDILFKYTRNHILEKVGKQLGLYWEEELMRKMMLIDLRFDQQMIGSKINLFRELQQIRDFFAMKSIVQLIDFPFFFIALFVIYLILPSMAIAPFLFSVGILIVNVLMQIPLSKLNKNNSHNLQSKQNFIVESIQGTESIKLNNAFSPRILLWKNIVAFSDSIAMKMQSLHMLSTNISQLMVQFVAIVVVIIGVFQIANQQLSVGGLIAVTMLASRAMVPIVNLSSILIRIQEMSESLNRINDFLSLPMENQKPVEIGLGKIKGKIELKNVTYHFNNHKHPTIDNVSFTIQPGERVGIIGQTGAGKSTLAKLLVGLYTPTSGAIYLDDHDMNGLHPIEVRHNISLMSQEPFLFSGTLKENIELSQPISKNRFMEIIKLTGLEELIKKLGKGDGLNVGEKGCHLSVGQKHLVALARAIANDPAVIIFDEPTTGLDMTLEKKLLTHLSTSIEKDKTLIVITHRLAALELVDRILVINEGKVVADGRKDIVINALRTPSKVVP